MSEQNEIPDSLVHSIYMVQNNKAVPTKKSPHRIMVFATRETALSALDQIRKLRQITPKFGGHKLVRRTPKVDGGMFDFWVITERELSKEAIAQIQAKNELSD